MTAPKPVERKRRAGNPGKRPLPTPFAIIPATTAVPAPPSGLGDAGVALWQQAWRVGASWLAPSDGPMLHLACSLTTDIATWSQTIASDGAVYVTDSGMRRAHPGVAQLNVLRRELRSTLSLLGFSPADRSRLGLTEVRRMSGLADLLDRRRESLGR